MILKGKTFIVTGGGNGIGKQLVMGLLNRGARVAIVDLNEDFLKETLNDVPAEYKDVCSIHTVDIADKSRVEELPHEVLKAHQQIDGLINNAGIIQPFVKINELDYPSIDKVMNVNFFGLLYMVKTFLPHLEKRPEAHLVNISSMGGFLPVPGQSIYGAAKAGVKLMTEALQCEMDGTNVHVSVVFPGAVGTDIAKNSGVEIHMDDAGNDEKMNYKTLAPEAAAAIILKGIESGKKRIYVGKDSKMMNALYRLSPGFATRMITKQMKSLLN